MGSGKTTLGRRAAAWAGVPFVDLDAWLEAYSGRSMRQLFAELGETGFRHLEIEALEEIESTTPAPCVLATGGGIVETAAAHAVLERLGCIVWLRADPQVCVERLRGERAARPLLDAGQDWKTRYARREPLYAALAAGVVDTFPHTVDTSLQELLAIWMRPRPAGG